MTEPAMRVTKTVFTQESDIAYGADADQEIIVFEENTGIGFDGAYHVLETERWAINSIEEIAAILRRAGVRETAPEDFIGTAIPGERVVTTEI